MAPHPRHSGTMLEATVAAVARPPGSTRGSHTSRQPRGKQPRDHAEGWHDLS